MMIGCFQSSRWRIRLEPLLLHLFRGHHGPRALQLIRIVRDELPAAADRTLKRLDLWHRSLRPGLGYAADQENRQQQSSHRPRPGQARTTCPGVTSMELALLR